MPDELALAIGAAGALSLYIAINRTARRFWFRRILSMLFNRPWPVLWIRNKTDLANFLKRNPTDVGEPYIILDMTAIQNDMREELPEHENIGDVGKSLTK